MRIIGGSIKAATSAVALAAALVPGIAAAQTLPDFSLPGARPTSNPRSQGPVDADNPVVRAPEVRPTPTPTPSPVPVTSANPVPSGPATTSSLPPIGRTVPARNSAPAPRTVTPVSPQPSASAVTGPAPSDSVTPFPLPSGSSPTTITATDRVIEAAPTDSASGSFWPWLASGIGVLVALLAGLWWRRRQSAEPALEFIPPVVPAPAAPPPVARITPAVPSPLPKPQPAATPQGLVITLEAKRMSASLMATTLSYALTLTNHSRETLSALAIEGDMIAAHASLPPEQQIASDGLRLEPRHALVTLSPGESAEFTGDFRLPLTAINPIRAGAAALFIPLARLRVEASPPVGQPLVQVQTYVVGETGDVPGAGLRPFRLDLGPRTYSRISQRAVN